MKNTNTVISMMTTLIFSAALIGCETAPPTIQTGPDAEVSFDGLHKVDHSQADLAWARADFDISGYKKIWPLGAGIEYRQVKDRGSTYTARSQGGPYFIDDKTRARFEGLVGEVFQEELQKVERYELADGPGPDVLMVRGGLLDVISYVPPDPVGRSNVYLSSVGAATLVLELRDSETGTILARSIDRRAAESPGGTLSYSSTVTNSSDVRRLVRRWATRLREGLDGFAQKSAEN